MSLQSLITENRRLAILRLLAADPGYAHNDSVLQTALKHIGHEVGRDKVKSDLAWLAEQELVTVEELEEIAVATLTGRGVDVAAGSVIVPGVKRPRPGK